VKLLISLFFLLSSSLLWGQVFVEDKPEFEEQRREYERYLHEKIDRSLLATLDKKSYILNVSVRLRNLPAETMEINSDKTPKNFLEVAQEFKKDDDSVPIPKIGTWNGEMTKNEENKRVYTKKIRTFSELVAGISIKLFFNDSTVSPQRAEELKNLVSNLLSGTTPVRVAITAQSLDLTNRLAEQREQEKQKSMKDEILAEVNKQLKGKEDETKRSIASAPQNPKELIAEFKNPLAIIFSTFLLFVLGLLVSRAHNQIQQKRLKIEETSALTKASAGQQDSSQSKPGSLSTVSLNSAAMNNPNYQSGFEQFKGIVNKQPERAAYLIKQWLYSGSNVAEAIVGKIPQVISIENLDSLLKLLNEDDRKLWNRANSASDHNFSFEELEQSLTQMMAQSLIEPDPELSPEIKQMITTITPQEGVACIMEDPAIGALLATALSHLQYARILSLLESSMIESISVMSESMGPQDYKYTAVKLEKTLTEVRKRNKAGKTAFIERVPELIKELGHTKEAPLFESLARSNDLELLTKTAMDFYPAHLLKQLPSAIIKGILDAVPLSEKAELIFSFESDKDFLLNSFSEGRLKEVITIEIDEIATDELRSRNIIRSKDKYFQDFLNRVRFKVRNDVDVQNEVAPILDNWAKQKIRSVMKSGESPNAA
jgi:hypothetical protein